MTDSASPLKKETNVKETIESILVAFILAFIFRCFVVEAFVIPTGSMAPTLLGAHMDLRCPHCGYGFTAGYGGGGGNFAFPEFATNAVYGLICPSCGLRLPENNPEDPANDAAQPAVKYGDRILVMKYIYLLNDPRRWDVVVFKSPETPDENPDDFSVNFIKRLVGKPGEALFVAQGDLFVAPPGVDAKDPKNFQIQTKPKWAQDALWRIVFDADFVPQATSANPLPALKTWQQPWREASGSGWINNDPKNSVSARQFAFDNPTGPGALAFDATANPDKASLTDWVAYDQSGENGGGNAMLYNVPSYGTKQGGMFVTDVSDLKISTVVDYLDKGSFRLVLGKGSAEFIAEFGADKVRLIRRNGSLESVISESPATIKSGSNVTLQNVDYQVTLYVDGKQVLQTTPQQYAPDVQQIIRDVNATNPGAKAFSPRGWARVEASQAKFRLSHLQLWRDVYYRDQQISPMGRAIFVARAHAWDFPKNVVRLRDEKDAPRDEYFVMGDNSAYSSDARMWTRRVEIENEGLDVDAGRVPGRFLLGQAFFVYWPAGYRPAGGLPAVVPNFGQMRFIR